MLIIITAVREHTAMTVRSLRARCAPLDITDLDAEMWGAPLRPTQHKQWHNLLPRGAVSPVLLTHTGHSLQTAVFQTTALSVATQGTKKSIMSAPKLLAQLWLSAMHTIPLQHPRVPGAVTPDTIRPQQAILRRAFNAQRGLILSVARPCAPAALLATMQVPGGNPHVSHARRGMPPRRGRVCAPSALLATLLRIRVHRSVRNAVQDHSVVPAGRAPAPPVLPGHTLALPRRQYAPNAPPGLQVRL